MAETFIYPRGATIGLAWEAAGDTAALAQVTGVSAVLKPAIAGAGVPAPDITAVATFQVTDRAATASVGPGWDLTIAPGVCAALTPGSYVTNLVVVFAGGGVQISDPLVVRIEQTTA